MAFKVAELERNLTAYCWFLDLVDDIKRCSKILDDQCMALEVVSEENWQFWRGSKRAAKFNK